MSSNLGPALSDQELFSGFESATLAVTHFHHREHVRVAFLYVRRHPDLAEAALHFRQALRRFAAVHGVSHIVHETLTWAYLALIHERAHGHEFASSEAFLDAHPELLAHRSGLLSRYYDVEALRQSVRAREVFVLPPRHGREA